MTRPRKSRDARIATARALHAMAERGDPNERESFRAKLNAFMHQYSLSDKDIDQWHVRLHTFTIPVAEQWLFAQVVASLLGHVLMDVLDDGISVTVKCADEDVVDIHAKFELFLRHYSHELSMFQAAFVAANQIYAAQKLKYESDAKVERMRKPTTSPPPLECEEPQEPAETGTVDEQAPDAVYEDPALTDLRIRQLTTLIRAMHYKRQLAEGTTP